MISTETYSIRAEAWARNRVTELPASTKSSEEPIA